MPGRKRETVSKANPNASWRVAVEKNITNNDEGVYSYTGEGGDSEENIGTFRTQQPLDPRGGTFEVKIIDTGERNCIAIGVCHEGYPSDSLPGWKEGSVAFHADDGSLFRTADTPEPLNRPCRAGDTVRCTLSTDPNIPTKVSVRFYHNGVQIASVPTDLPAGGFYGIVGMMSKGEQVQLQPLMIAQVTDFEHLWHVCTPPLVVHQGNGCVAYIGPGGTEQYVGTIRSKVKVDPMSLNNGFVVEILQAGESRCIAIGVCSSSYPSNMLPGWEEPSVGYHGDCGQLFKNGDGGVLTNKPWQTGDVVQCTVEPVDRSAKEVRISFYHNNALAAVTNSWVPEGGFYFCVGMMNQREQVRICLPEILSPYVPQKLNFADVWEVKSHMIQYQGLGTCSYIGPGGHDNVATVRSKQPLDPSSRQGNVFEVKILGGSMQCCIAVGVCSANYPSEVMPGWQEMSIGYHADDGCVHQGVSTGHRTSHLCQVGDVMKCVVEPQDGSLKEVVVMFYKNGMLIHQVIQWSPAGGFYALIGMMNKGEVVQIASPLMDPSMLQPGIKGPPPALPLGRVLHHEHELLSTHSHSSVAPPISTSYQSHEWPSPTTDHNSLAVFPPTSYHPYSTPYLIPHGTPPHYPPLYYTGPYASTHPYPGYYVPHLPFYPESLKGAAHPRNPLGYGFDTPSYGSDTYNKQQSYPPGLPLSNPARAFAPQTSAPSPSPSSEQQMNHSDDGTDGGAGATVSRTIPHITAGGGQIDDSLPLPVQQPFKAGREQLSMSLPIRAHQKQLSEGDVSAEIKPSKSDELHSRPVPCELGVSSVDHDRQESSTLFANASFIPSATAEPTATITTTSCMSALPSHTFDSTSSHSLTGDKVFQYLLSVACIEDNILQCLSDDEASCAYIMCRRPLTEKVSYFEVEVCHVGTNGLIQLGLVPSKFPYRVLPGTLQGSIGCNLCSGTLHLGPSEYSQPFPVCTSGDVIGCKVHLHYKQEAISHTGGSTETVKVEFFRNGNSVRVECMPLPCCGLFPAVAMVGKGTQIAFRSHISLTPESYFSKHSLPNDVVNFSMPPSLTQQWNCIQNAVVNSDGSVAQPLSSGRASAILQSTLPFSQQYYYCELELLIPLSKFSILSLGVLPKISSPSRATSMIPGEGQSTVGFLPLLGFFMKNGVISSTLPDSLANDMRSSTGGLTIGFGIQFISQSSPDSGLPVESAEVFFTVNSQQWSSTMAVLPPDGFYPTIVFDTDMRSEHSSLVKVTFPKLWPSVEKLPYGFVRGSGRLYVSDRCSAALRPGNMSSVEVIQGGFPFSSLHTYYEVQINRITNARDALISVGVASYHHPLDVHPGQARESIAFHAHDGAIYEPNVGRQTVAPNVLYPGLKVGCGARFPADGNTRNVEIFFTLNRQVVARRSVANPVLGLFPTLGLQGTETMVCLLYPDLFVPDPFPDLVYNSQWLVLENVHVSGQQIYSKVPTKPGLAQLDRTKSKDSYFTVSLPQPVNRSIGKIYIGCSNSRDTPFGGRQLPDHRSFFMDIVSGTIVWCDPQFHSDAVALSSSRRTLGCGIWSLNGLTMMFFTADDQVVYTAPLNGIEGPMFLTVCLIDCHARVSTDLCAIWPPVSKIGQGWGRIANLWLAESKISHTLDQATFKAPVGFAQSAFPLSLACSYFEVEIASQDPKKVVAVGLVGRDFPVNSWIGMSEHSIAYYSDSGKLYAHSNIGKECGPKLSKGDCVGCGIVFDKGSQTNVTKSGENTEVFFTINGAVVGKKKMGVPNGGLFPTICLEAATSLIPSFHFKFPVVFGFVGKEWAVAYCICQTGQYLCYRGRHQGMPGGLAKGFCQAANMLSSSCPYFEMEVTSCSAQSILSIGVGTRIRERSTAPDQDVLLYSCSGELVTKRGSQKSTRMLQKFSFGDLVGCHLSVGSQTQVEFYLNGIKVITVALPEGSMRTKPLFPIVMLSQPGDMVIPRLNIPLPQWDSSSLIGWLRSEKVTIRNNIVEYKKHHVSSPDVGGAQISQVLAFSGITYYEVEILDQGNDCAVGIGAASADYQLTQMPGWRKESIGYHGDDGCLFHSSSFGQNFGPRWKQKDVVGLGIRSASGVSDPGSEVQVFFTKNGHEVGHLTITIPGTGLFPTIGLFGNGEKVKVSIVNRSMVSSGDASKLIWRTLTGIVLCKDNTGQLILKHRTLQHKTAVEGIWFGTAVAHQPFSEALQYFQLDLLQYGKLKAICIGLVPREHSIEQACGWGTGSVAYHTDTGHLHSQSGRGQVFGPVPRTGDTIGCGISFLPNTTKHCSVFFTYNGQEIGRTRVAVPDKGLYPAITLTSPGDRVAVSFQEAFKPRSMDSEHQTVGLHRIVNCSYSNQLVHFSGGTMKETAIVHFAVALHREQNYFSANIVNVKDTVVVGLATRDFPAKELPGSCSVSVGYDLTKGQISAVFSIEKFCQLEAPKCNPGDIVGCGMEVLDSKAVQGVIIFTRNGVIVQRVELDHVFDDLYPIVGILPRDNCSTLFMLWNNIQMSVPNAL